MPEWLSNLIGTAFYVVITIIGAAATVGIFVARLVRRVAVIEQRLDDSGKGDTLERFRQDLIKHQEEDCERLDELIRKATATNEIVIRTDERMTSVQEAIRELKDAIKHRPSR